MFVEYQIPIILIHFKLCFLYKFVLHFVYSFKKNCVVRFVNSSKDKQRSLTLLGALLPHLSMVPFGEANSGQ